MRAVIRVAVEATALLGAKSGVGQFVAGALSGLAKRGDIEASAFAVSWRRRGMLQPMLPEGVRSGGRPMPARPLSLIWSRVDFPPIEAFVGRCDVVHGTNFVVPPALFAKRVVTVHDLTPMRFPEMCHGSVLAYPRLVERAINAGAYVHTPSQFVRSEVINLLGADPSRVFAIPHGVPTRLHDTDAPLLRSIQSDDNDRYILAIGTIEPRKDYPTLLRAFDILAKTDSRINLVIAGSAGWGFEEFKSTLGSISSSDRVRHVGYVDDEERAALLLGASAFVYPSIYEGFGLPPLEAMDFGVPVVATRAGAIPEVVSDAALLVDVGDAGALSSAISTVLEDQVARSGLIAAGAKRVSEFTWTRTAELLANLYQTALHG